MERPKRLEGVIIALPTPLLKNEHLDTQSLRRLLDYCVREGTNGIMVLGTMGEGTALIASQRQLLVEETVTHISGRVPVLATISAPSTSKAIGYSKDIEKTGVDYIVCTTPFYYKFPDPKSILLHIQSISDAVDVPLIFYNAPGMTGNHVDVDTTDRILNMPRVAGIKDSSCNYGNFVELLRRYPDKHDRPGTIMQGDESVFDSSLLMGADGVVSGAGIIFIKMLIDLYHASVNNDRIKTMKIQTDFTSEVRALLGPNPNRDWLSNIKKKLVDMNIIDDASVTSPFF